MDPRIARKWHKPVKNAMLWEKMQKWKIMLDFRLFAVKSMKFSLTRFSKIQVYLFIFLFIYLFIYLSSYLVIYVFYYSCLSHKETKKCMD